METHTHSGGTQGNGDSGHRSRHSRGHHRRRCPSCDSTDVHRVSRSKIAERLLLPLILRRPFQCGKCGARFQRFSVHGHSFFRAVMQFVLLLGAAMAIYGIFRVFVQMFTPPAG